MLFLLKKSRKAFVLFEAKKKTFVIIERSKYKDKSLQNVFFSKIFLIMPINWLLEQNTINKGKKPGDFFPLFISQ